MKSLAAWIVAHSKETAAALLVVFTPLKPVVITVCCLVMCDFFLGVGAAKKRGEAITSSGFKATVAKILLYEVALALSFLVETYLTGTLFPACKFVSALVGLVELKSILENLDAVYGKSVFATLLEKITQKSKSLE